MLVILVTTWTVLHLAVTERSSSSSGSPYTLGHMEEVLVGVEDWGRGIRMGKWNQSIIPVGRVHPYNEHWGRKSNLQIILTKILKPFHHKFFLLKKANCRFTIQNFRNVFSSIAIGTNISIFSPRLTFWQICN